MSKTAKMIIDKLNTSDVPYTMAYISRAIRCRMMMDSVKMSLIW